MTTQANQAVVQALVNSVNPLDWRRFDELVAPVFVGHSSTFGQLQITTRDRLRESARYGTSVIR